MGSRIAVYDHGGHLGNLGDRQQIADMLAMLGRALAGGIEMRSLLLVLMSSLSLAACATQGVHIRTLPEQTPAADAARAVRSAAEFAAAEKEAAASAGDRANLSTKRRR